MTHISVQNDPARVIR